MKLRWPEPFPTDDTSWALLAATYALLVSLLPALATLIGLIVLAQVPTPKEAGGVLLVAAGVGLNRG